MKLPMSAVTNRFVPGCQSKATNLPKVTVSYIRHQMTVLVKIVSRKNFMVNLACMQTLVNRGRGKKECLRKKERNFDKNKTRVRNVLLGCEGVKSILEAAKLLQSMKAFWMRGMDILN